MSDTNESPSAPAKPAWYSGSAGQSLLWLLIGFLATVIVVLGYQAIQSSVSRSVSNRQSLHRLDAATQVAGSWLTGEVELPGGQVEEELTLSLLSSEAPEDHLGWRVLQQVRERCEVLGHLDDEQRAADLWQRITQDIAERPFLAKHQLQQFLELAPADRREDAEKLLTELELASNDAHAVRLLLELSQEAFDRRRQSPQLENQPFDDARINQILERTLDRNLPRAAALRQVNTVAKRMEELERRLSDMDTDLHAEARKLPPDLQVHMARHPEFCRAFLEAGDFENGRTALERARILAPDDDQLSYSLAVLRFFQSIEKFGRAMHRHGLKTDLATAPMVRIPVLENPNPEAISNADLRRVLEEFARDLRQVDQLLADVDDSKVRVHLQLSRIAFDFNEDGAAESLLGDMARDLLEQEFAFLENDNPLEVHFDLADAVWLRIYSGLMANLLDIVLSIDTQPYFDYGAKDLFARPQIPGPIPDKPTTIVFIEPERLERIRLSLIAITRLNDDMWRLALAEGDNDFEWIPNPLQKSVLGISVRQEAVQTWRNGLPHVRWLLEGDTAIPIGALLGRNGKGLSVRRLLADPPSPLQLDSKWMGLENLEDKYFTDDPDAEIGPLYEMFEAYDDWIE